MNNIFKIIWSHSAQLFVVTSELAKGKVKSASSSKKISSVTSSTTSKISLLSASILLSLSTTNVNAAVVLNNYSYGNSATVQKNSGTETVPAPKATDTGIAIGNNANAYGDGSLISIDLIAIGNNATTSEHTQRVTVYNYLTPGNTDWRAITGRLTNVTLDPNQVYYSLGDTNTWEAVDRAVPAMALGYESFAHGGSVAIGGYSHAGEKVGSGTGAGLSVAIGAYTTATGSGAVAMGPAASAQGNNSFALMRQASATGINSMALGAASYASTDGAIAIGRLATSTGKNSIAIGTGGEGATSPSYRDRTKATESTGNNTIAMGHNVKVKAEDSIGIGREAKANQINSVALGALSETRDATAETTGTVNNFTYGNFHAQGSAANGVVSIGKTGAERQLIHVAAGKVSADSTDAINGSQLFVTNRGLSYLGDTLVTNILGGNAAVVKNGDTLGSLTMTNIGGTGKNTIDDAIKAAKTEVKTEKQATLKTDTGANGQSIYTIGATKTTLTEGTKVSVTGGEEDANGIINYTVGIDKPTSDKIDSIGTGNVAAGDSNTVTGATVHQYIEDNPITFVGEDNANPLKKKLGETLKFTSGDIDSGYKGANLKVKSDGTDIVVGFKESPTFKDITADSLNIANGGPTINKDGINMNGKKITNLAPGEADTDAVNVSQLKDSVQNVNNSSPFEYAKGDEPLVKGKDGQFYPAKNFAQLTYDPATNSYKDANNTPVTPVDNNEVVIRAKGDTPQPVTNVKSNLPATYNKDANNPTTTVQAAPSAEDVKNIGNNAATVNDILNAGWNLQENGGAKDFVKAYDTVNFVDGEGTKANVTVREDGTIADVTFNIDKGNITVDPNGTGKAEGTPEADIKAAEEKVKEAEEKLANLPNNASDEDKAKAAKDVADAKKAVSDINNKVATVENVVNAINNVSWTATSGQKGTGISTAATEEKVKAGDTVKFNAGDNLKIEQAGKDFTYSLNPELKKLTSAEFKDKNGNKTETTADGIKITSATPDKDPVSLTSAGLDNGNNKITNVSAGEKDTDAVNVSQLKAAKADINNVANNVQSLEDNSPFEYADKDGNPVKKGLDGKYYKPESLKDKVFVDGKYYNKDDVKSDGTLKDPATAQAVNPIDPTLEKVVIRAKGDEPQQVTNIKSNLPDTYNQVVDENGAPIKDADGNPVTTTTAQKAPSTADIKNIGNNAATVNDILNAGWNLQENGGAKDFVKAYDTVNFVDGEGTKANVTVREDGTIADVTFNIDKGNITVDPNGTGKAEGTPEADIKAAEEKVKEAEEKLANLPNNASDEDKAKAAKDVADAKKAVSDINNKVATVENVVNAINNVSWTATSGQKGTGISTAATEEKVKAGDTVKFNAGDNLKIEQAGKDFTYSLNPELKKLTSAEFVATDPKGNKITTVTDGNGITITPEKPEEGKAPVSLTSNGLSNGNNSITNVKSNLPNTYNQVLDKDGNPIKDTNGNPVTTTASQAAPSAEDVKNMGNNAATVNDILNAGWNLQENGGAKDFVKAYDTVNFVNGEGTKANVTVREDGKIADVTFNIDKGNITMNPDNSGTVQGTPQSEKDAAEKALKAAKDTLANLPTTAPKSVKDAAEKALQDAQKGVDNINNRVATVENVAYAINNAAWNVDAGTVENSNGKLVKGSSDKPTKVKAGNTVKLNAGNNIEIKRNAHSIDIATSATPSFTNVSLGSDGAKIGSDGQGNVRVSNAQGAPTRITNVAPGINNTDAVNYGQLRGAVNNINNRINKVDKDLRAGVAGAAAIAFIQRPNEAGKSIVSVGAAGYRGESALAVGYARNADNNKISIKLGVGLNSRNDVTYGGSVGYQW